MFPYVFCDLQNVIIYYSALKMRIAQTINYFLKYLKLLVLED